MARQGSAEITTRITSSWIDARRRWRAWRKQLRHRRASIALLVVLVLALGEPLACIFHCQVWLPLVLHSYFAAQHQHHHHVAPGPASAAAPLPDAVTSLQAAGTDSYGCSMIAGHGPLSDLPTSVPPSPVHEMLPGLALALIIVLLIVAHRLAPPGAPPLVFIPPRLRPPILIAR